MTTSSSSSDMKWSELLECIGNHLDSRIDVFRFRAVSTLCRSLVPLSHLQSHPIPLNLPPPISAAATLSAFTVCRLEHQTRSSACLVKVVDSTTSGKLQLVHHLNSLNVSAFHFLGSKNKSSSDSRRSINMLDFRLVELAKGFSLEFKSRWNDFRIRKVVSFGNQGIIVLFDSGKLWYWKFGDADWVHMGTETTHYNDIMVYKNKFYVIDNLGIISWFDDRSMNLVQYDAPPLCGFGHVKQLVVSEGQFYVVDSYLEGDVVGGVQLEFDIHNHNRDHLRVDIKVYKLDEEWGTWVDVKSLGDRVFVLGKEVSYSVSATDFPRCPGDCIYFVDPRMDYSKQLVVRVFRFDNGTIRTMDCVPAYKRLFSPSALWFRAALSPP